MSSSRCLYLFTLVASGVCCSLSFAAPPTQAPNAPIQQPVDRFEDPLPAGATARFGTVRWRHSHDLLCLALSSDGKLLVTGTYAGEVSLWYANSGVLIAQLAKRSGNISAVAISPDGKTVVAGGDLHDWDGQHGIDVWENVGDDKQRTHQQLKSSLFVRTGLAAALAFSPNGQYLAIGCGDGPNPPILVWDLQKGEVVHQLVGHTSSVRTVAFSPDGKQLATADGTTSVRLWDLKTGKQTASLEGDPTSVGALAYSPDGKTLATVGHNTISTPKTLTLWDVAAKRLRQRIPFATLSLSVAFSRDGKQVAVGGYSEIHLRNADDGKAIRTFPIWGGSVHSLAFSPNGKTLFAGTGANAASRWNVATGTEVDPLPAHASPIESVAFTPDGKKILSRATDSTIRIWDAKTSEQVHMMPYNVRQFCGGSHSQPQVHRLAVSPNGEMFATVGYKEKGPDFIQLADVASGKKLVELTGALTCAVSFASNGKDLIAGNNEGLHLWNLEQRKRSDAFPFPKGHPREWLMYHGVFFLGDSRVILAGGRHGISLLNRDSGKVVMQVDGCDWEVGSLALSGDGRLFAANPPTNWPLAQMPVCIWETATGRLVQTLKGTDVDKPATPHTFTSSLAQVALSPDGRFLATAGLREKVVRLFDVLTGKQVAKFTGHLGGVTCVAFSPDGSQIVSGSADTTLLLWDVRKYTQPLAKTSLDAAALERLWDDLASDDAARAFRAMDSLAAAGDQTVAMLRNKLKPATLPAKEDVARLIRELDARLFAVRDKAHSELARLGELVETELQAARNNKPLLQTERLLDELLAGVRPWVKSRDTLRALRAVALLTRFGTADARGLLETLAGGVEQARLTREARTALERVIHRDAGKK